MLTGTPLDLTVIPELLAWLGKAIPIAWLLLLVGGLVFAWRKPSTTGSRVLAVAAVLGALVLLPAVLLNKMRQEALQQRTAQEAKDTEFRQRYEKAEVLFKKRCETAGEFIDKTVPDVKGVVWMKWRPLTISLNDQFEKNDPYGHDCGGEECFEELLVATEGVDLPYQGEYLRPYGTGYEFIEVRHPTDGRLYRYRLRLYRVHDRDPRAVESAVRSELLKEPIQATTAQFGVTWDDLSTHEDRENWITGGTLSVVDLKTNQVIAKRVGYMMDKGLGNKAGFRSPWGFAEDYACPAKVDDQGKRISVGFTRRFTFKVLQPNKGVEK
jgi:hypothetical protein